MKKNKKLTTRADLEIEANLRAWKDPQFKKELLKNPREALKKLDYPQEMIPENVSVIEESGSEQIIVLHEAPKKMVALSEAELQMRAAKLILCTAIPSTCGRGN